ncbi:MAG TPA: hypothetical protein PKD96_01995 [Candidatus Absconditabacterales bacterium]|nr:hypothetical protein [Candidatus Absconditabacterales bacterium]HMT27051.1 hypothetical protein [Candidatus Absconditabacterales bacterium]
MSILHSFSLYFPVNSDFLIVVSLFSQGCFDFIFTDAQQNSMRSHDTFNGIDESVSFVTHHSVGDLSL